MSRWIFLVLVAMTIVCFGVSRLQGAAVEPAGEDVEEIGVRAMPNHDSEAMIEFKNGLNDEEKDLLKRHLSKTRFIQPLMDSSRVMVNRRNKLMEAAAVVSKRSETSSDCCSCSPDSEGCYHPDDIKRSNIIQCCRSPLPPPEAETVAVDERQVKLDAAGQEALKQLSQADQELLQKYKSKISNLIEAEKRPESNGNTVRRDQVDEAETVDVDGRQVQVSADGQKALSQLSPEDSELLKKYMSKIGNLIEAEQRPESNGNTEKRTQVDDVESVDKKDTVATGTVIQKLYNQLEGLKEVVNELKTQQLQQPVEKKSLNDAAQASSADTSDLDDISQRFWADVSLAKEKGVKVNELLEAIKKRALKQTKAKQDE